ncbi:MAG: VOC family protein [Flavobacteriaceae bacterium]
MQGFQFNHIALAVKDVNESIFFYQKVFGFDEIENTASNSKTRWLSLGEGKELHLIPRPEAEVKVVKAVHVAFNTNNFDGFILHIESLKIHYSDWSGKASTYNVRNDNIKQLYFQDPNGYWIEVNDAGSA